MKLQKRNLLFTILISYLQPSLQWLPTRDAGMIRGVNLGGLFISEPWMMMDEWQNMGCANTKSEFDCVRLLGQAAADNAFQNIMQHGSPRMTLPTSQTMASTLSESQLDIGSTKIWLIEAPNHFHTEG